MDSGFGSAVRQAVAVEARAEEADEADEESNDGEQDAIAVLELDHASLEVVQVAGEDFGGDDGARPTAKPACGGGAGDAEMGEEPRVAFEDGEVAEAVVIGIPASRAGEVHVASGEKMAWEGRRTCRIAPVRSAVRSEWRSV